MRRWRMCVAIAGLATTSANAGVYIETADREAGAKQATTVQRIWVEGGAARFENEGDVSILKGEKLYVLQPKERSYLVIDEAAVKAMGERMGGAMAQMQAQMANLPPEQRAMMERMLGGNMPGAAPAPVKIDVVDTGRTESVDGRTCRTWTLKRNGVAEEQHCIVAFASMPGKEDLRAVFARMGKLFDGLADALPQGPVAFDQEFAAYEKMNGFPLLTRELAKGKPTGAETRVVAWRAESVPAAQFAIPAGYKQRDLAAELGD